jgi:hypothetical protein
MSLKTQEGNLKQRLPLNTLSVLISNDGNDVDAVFFFFFFFVPFGCRFITLYNFSQNICRILRGSSYYFRECKNTPPQLLTVLTVELSESILRDWFRALMK